MTEGQKQHNPRAQSNWEDPETESKITNTGMGLYILIHELKEEEKAENRK
jgi:hypothetical protein